MKISLIIPTYNAAEYLPALLEKLQTQTCHFELIIIDSSSEDHTLDIARKYTQHIHIIPQNRFDHGGTRTQAAKTATGDIIVFLTQDALPYDNNSIEQIVKVFQNPNIGAAYGRQLPYAHTSLFGKHLREFNYGDTSYIRTVQDKERYGIKTAFLSDSFAAYRKDALEQIDWFKNGLIVGEDSYAGAKILLAHYAIAYVAEAKVYHSHTYSCIEEFKRYFDIGVFHACESWILEHFGKAEGEGGRYVKSEIRYLLKAHAYYRIPEFFIRNALKYLGYKLGQNYPKLSKNLILKLSMHRHWWK
jgi:rhamnosyltransferase